MGVIINTASLTELTLQEQPDHNIGFRFVGNYAVLADMLFHAILKEPELGAACSTALIKFAREKNIDVRSLFDTQ